MRIATLTSMGLFMALGSACSSDKGIAPGTGPSGTTSSTGSGSSGSTTTTGSGGTGGSGVNPIPPKLDPGTCGLQQPAFCEKFNMASPGGRGGNLDDSIWSFSRWAHAWELLWARKPASTYGPEFLFPSTFCGQPFMGIMPTDDVKVCAGTGADGMPSFLLNEVFDDQEDFAFHSMRIRQPFDFADRTGIIVWDVDGKINPLNLGHGWWFEMWVTEDPQPMPYHEAPAVTALPRKGLGLAFRFGGGCPKDQNDWQSALETVNVTDDYKFLHAYPNFELTESKDKCIKVADAHLNHFELHMTKDRLELWASDYDNPGSFKLRTTAEHLDLGFTRGYVHFQHAQYNASKDGHVTRSQTFRWDNIGFDGPTFPTPRAYDVPDNDEKVSADATRFGWYLDDGKMKTFSLPNVDLSNAISASFNFNLFEAQGQTLQYRFNGKAWHSFVVPVRDGSFTGGSVRSHSLPAPLEELVSGTNTIDVQVPSPVFVEGIGNIDLTVEVPQ